MSNTVLTCDPNVKEIVTKLTPEIEKNCKQKFTFFDAIEYRVSQVIGVMYLIKVDTGLTHNYLHLEVYVSPCDDKYLVALTKNNMRNDPLVPLVWRE